MEPNSLMMFRICVVTLIKYLLLSRVVDDPLKNVNRVVRLSSKVQCSNQPEVLRKIFIL